MAVPLTTLGLQGELQQIAMLKIITFSVQLSYPLQFQGQGDWGIQLSQTQD